MYCFVKSAYLFCILSFKNILLVRYEKERLQDQMKIQNLTEDFKLLKIKLKNGELQQLAETRSSEKANSSCRKEDDKSRVNRFAGLENRDQMVGILNLYVRRFCKIIH